MGLDLQINQKDLNDRVTKDNIQMQESETINDNLRQIEKIKNDELHKAQSKCSN